MRAVAQKRESELGISSSEGQALFKLRNQIPVSLRVDKISGALVSILRVGRKRLSNGRVQESSAPCDVGPSSDQRSLRLVLPNLEVKPLSRFSSIVISDSHVTDSVRMLPSTGR